MVPESCFFLLSCQKPDDAAVVSTCFGPVQIPLAQQPSGRYDVITLEADAMRTRIVRIGNSRGIRIPKPMIEELGLRGEVEIAAKGRALLILPARRPREGWAEAFQTMAKRRDDPLLDGDVQGSTRWDKEEWEWR